MEACGRKEVYLHAFLILEVDLGSDQLHASTVLPRGISWFIH
jgi:hypothetical protein